MAFAFTINPRIFCKCKCHFWIWRMINRLYYSSRKIQQRCENSFVNYRINYQKLCDLMRQITKEMNWWCGKMNYSFCLAWTIVQKRLSNPNVCHSLCGVRRPPSAVRDFYPEHFSGTVYPSVMIFGVWVVLGLKLLMLNFWLGTC